MENNVLLPYYLKLRKAKLDKLVSLTSVMLNHGPRMSHLQNVYNKSMSALFLPCIYDVPSSIVLAFKDFIEFIV